LVASESKANILHLAGGVLDAGMIGFAEPGVYLKPAGGFRIEDRGEAIPGA
jgi:Xaa-Pro aminopeptidase